MTPNYPWFVYMMPFFIPLAGFLFLFLCLVAMAIKEGKWPE